MNDVIFKSFLHRVFFDSWKTQQPKGLELIVSDVCDHNCAYCYYKRYGNMFFDDESRNGRNILKNLDIILRWLDENNYVPTINVFSGEIFSTETGFEVVNRLIEYIKPEKKIVLPTNMSFLLDDKKTERVVTLCKKRDNLVLSASIDGKYMEDNRPLKTGQKRDDAYYDKLFSFSHEYNIGLHPMIYSTGIEKWKDNFLWFVKNIEKYNLDITKALYLLEVRNSEWTAQQCRELMCFIEFLVDWSWDFCGRNVENMKDFIINKGGFNILNVASDIPRGIGCSVQMEFGVTLGNLTFPICHRTAYRNLLGGRFVVENNAIVDIKAENFVTYINAKSYDANTQPYCQTCIIKYLCNKQCLGAQYETTGDLFTPIPTVCRMEHAKIISILRSFERIGVLSYIFEGLSEKKKNCLKILRMEGLV